MKFLHTSDWHVGRTIRNRSRIDEHRAVFAEILDIAKQEQVDAVLVTGDIFHERRPALEAQELVAETLADLARERIPSVLIPGNHDDPSLLRALKPLGTLVQAHIVPEVVEDLSSLIVPIAARTGGEKALIGCLPYLHPHLVLSTAESMGMTEEARLSAYQVKVQDFFRALVDGIQRTDRGAVSIVLAHLHLLECEFGGGEWRSSVFPVNTGFLPAHVQYVALGHLHKPQIVEKAKSQTRYAGSILQMDFGERDQKKSVCLINVAPGKPATVNEITLSKGKWLLRRTGTAEAILAQAHDFTDAWVEVVLSLDKPNMALVDKIRGLPEVISLRFAELQEAVTTTSDRDQRSRVDRPAGELFREYYQSKRKTDPEPQLMALFERLYQEASTARDEA
ncbi:MAG: exonuclease SbcCD subunit D [Deltaproteobacteria bacterium]|nr:exonuclease SbcCD subunit D [Deltaproteobacteria bacterium]